MKNELSIEQIYEEYYRRVFAYLNSRLNNYHDAEDLCEDVFAKVSRKINTFDQSKSALSTWIYNITKNTLIDHYRTDRQELELLDGFDYAKEDDPVSPVELADLANAMEKLPEQERDIIVFRYYEGYSLKEIAEKMGMSYGVVKLRHNDALSRLRSCLDH